MSYAEDGLGLGEKLRRLRLIAGLSQEELARRSGLTGRTIARLEQGHSHRPHPESARRLAEALQLLDAARTDFMACAGQRQSAPGGSAPHGHDPSGELADQVADTSWDSLPAVNGASPRGPAQAEPRRDTPRQLPSVAPGFTGRAAELKTLTRILDEAGGGPPGTVVISAIGGSAGVGKTTLALHWAHQVADRFPDGQLHLNLRGFDPSGNPAAPTEAARGLLDALGVPPERIPPGADAQAGLYRSLVAGKRMLIVLDNARDEQQVRPLLPASPASLVIITSRNQLPGLAAANGARLLSLDVLTDDEAVQLLTTRLGKDRAAAEPGAIDQIAALCACLPLALSVAAARAAARPCIPLSALAAELRGAASRLDALETGDPAASVRTVFSWSYQRLSPAAARMFRLLGLHPGPDISIPAAGSLAGTDQAQARRLLDDLARDCLITEHAPGRYAFHDLLRAYAADKTRDCCPEPGRDAAIGRALDHYLHSAHRAAMLLDPRRDPLPLPAPAVGVSPHRMADHGEALAWYEDEYQVLLAAARLAAAGGFDRHAWQIPWAMAGFLNRRGHWNEWHDAERAALAATVRAVDTHGQAHVQHGLGDVTLFMGRPREASAHYGAALDLYRELGDRAGQARARQFLAVALQWQGRHQESLAHAWRAVRLFRVIGHRAGEFEATTVASHGLALLGRHALAGQLCGQAIRQHHELGNHPWEAIALTSLGYIRHAEGTHGAAIDCFTRALGMIREKNSLLRLECFTLTLLAEAQQAAGDLNAARTRERALAITGDLRDPDASTIRARLSDPSTPIHRLWW